VTVFRSALIGAAGSGGGGGSGVYFRLYITDNNGDASTRVYELELRETIGGANFCTGADKVATSASDAKVTSPASNAFDGDDGTFWFSENSTLQESSDGVSWTTLDTQTNQLDTGAFADGEETYVVP